MSVSLTEEHVEAFIAECHESLELVEDDLSALARSGANASPQTVESLFRAFHTVKGAAAYLQHEPMRQLGHLTEKILAGVRDGNLQLPASAIQSLHQAADRMREMVADGRLHANVRCDTELEKLQTILRPKTQSVPQSTAAAPAPAAGPPPENLRVLIVEDDFACRVLLQGLLSKYGECHIAVNGKEAIAAFRQAWKCGKAYHLICMDIQMPEMGGQEAVEQIRALEKAEASGVVRAKVFMTTGIKDMKTIMASFKALCDAYLFKPIRGEDLEDHLKSFNLIAADFSRVTVRQ